ncbi:MAG: aspartate kinase, partial [Ferruginibacter sp.]
MQVLKFGGSSVANAAVIQQVISIIEQSSKKDSTIVVLSAMGGITDLLIQCGTMAAQTDEAYKETIQQIEERHLTAVRELLPVTQQSSLLSTVKKYCNEIDDICSGVFSLQELSARTLDRLVSFGELLSSHIIAAALNAKNIIAEWKDSRELIITNSGYGNAAVDFEKTFLKMTAFFGGNKNKLFIVPGFIASDENNITTTLGRGGSDYTAAIFAAATNATVLEIWTDVSGMMTADPRLVGNAKHIPSISYQEAMELSHFGAKVIYPPTIQPVMKKNIPVWIKNTFAPQDTGTLIENESSRDQNTIRGISSIGSISLLSLEGSGMVGIPGFSKRLFEALSNEKINVILITQSSSEHSICVGIDAANTSKAKQAVDHAFDYEIKTGMVDPLFIERDLAIIALVGDQMRHHTGVSGKMFNALGRNGVNIRAIAQGSSERNISTVIDNADVKKAINVLHETFFETSYRQLNLFIIGAGNVGGKLLSQLQQQQEWLQKKLHLQLRVVGLANSRTML